METPDAPHAHGPCVPCTGDRRLAISHIHCKCGLFDQPLAAEPIDGHSATGKLSHRASVLSLFESRRYCIVSLKSMLFTTGDPDHEIHPWKHLGRGPASPIDWQRACRSAISRRNRYRHFFYDDRHVDRRGSACLLSQSDSWLGSGLMRMDSFCPHRLVSVADSPY